MSPAAAAFGRKGKEGMADNPWTELSLLSLWRRMAPLTIYACWEYKLAAWALVGMPASYCGHASGTLMEVQP